MGRELISDIDRVSLQAELRWMKAHYEAALSTLRLQNEALQSGAPQELEPEVTDDHAELAELRAEVDRMRAGERRYLDRIEELKTALAALKRSVGARA